MDSLPQVGQFVGSLLFGSLTGLQCDHPEWGLVGKLATMSFCRSDLGCILLKTPAILLSTGGWQGVFHLHGALGFCWAVLWLSTAADGPSEDKRCSAGEQSYIEATLAAEAAACTARVQGEATTAGKQKETTAVGSAQVLSGARLALAIACSPPVWGIVIVQSFSSFTNYALDDG